WWLRRRDVAGDLLADPAHVLLHALGMGLDQIGHVLQEGPLPGQEDAHDLVGRRAGCGLWASTCVACGVWSADRGGSGRRVGDDPRRLFPGLADDALDLRSPASVQTGGLTELDLFPEAL